MKRITIIFFLSTIMLACQNKSIDKTRIEKIGLNLIKLDTTIAKPVSSDIVNIGAGLHDKLKEIRSKAKSYKFKITTDDLINYGNEQADCILTIDTDITDIKIRLKYNKGVDKYDILGWLTI